MIRNEATYSHGQGWSHLREYRGGDSEVTGVMNALIDGGWECSTSRDDQYTRLVATRGGSEFNAETDFYDKFSITKETLQKSIWTLPKIVKAVDEFGVANTGYSLPFFKMTIEEALSSGDEAEMVNWFGPKPGTAGDYTGTAWSVYNELCRGADSYETEYIVLARERVVSVEYYVTDTMPIPQANSQYIYTSSAALRGAFGIPTIDGVTWPDDAGAPTNSTTDLQWGWRERRREIRWQEGARVEVSQDWVWAEWSTNLYQIKVV